MLGFDASGKKIVDSGWQTGKTYTLGKDVASYRLLFSYSDNRSLSSADTLAIMFQLLWDVAACEIFID